MKITLGRIVNLIMRLLAWIALIYLGYTIIKLRETAAVPENVFSKQGFFYAAIFSGILLLILAIEAALKYISIHDIKVLRNALKEGCGLKAVKIAIRCVGIDEEIANRIAFASIYFAVILLGYLVLPFFHNQQAIVVVEDVYKKVDTIVYTQKNDTIEIPINTAGKEAVVISLSKDMEPFMKSFYEENQPFFAKENLTILLLRNGKLESFDGNFENITYSGENDNTTEILQSLNYDTIWLFSSEMEELSPFDGEVQEKVVVVYSPSKVDISNLKTYFEEAVGITIRDLK